MMIKRGFKHEKAVAIFLDLFAAIAKGLPRGLRVPGARMHWVPAIGWRK